MAVRRNLTATLASLANTTTQLDLALATIQNFNEATVANFSVEIGLYSGYVAVGLTGAARLAWLQFKQDKIFPLDRLSQIIFLYVFCSIFAITFSFMFYMFYVLYSFWIDFGMI